MNITKQKKTKFLLTIGSTIGLGALVVSCGANQNNSSLDNGTVQNSYKFNFDTKDDNQLVFAHSFSSTGAETKALEEIIKQWNETAKNLPGFLKIKLQNFQGGYSKVKEIIQSSLGSQDKNNIPNIVTNYPSLLAVVNSNKMALPIINDFESSEPSGSDAEKQLYQTLKKDAIDVFLNFNKEIPALNPKGIYSLPFAKSSEIISINKMVLAYIVDKALNDSATRATIANNDALFTEISKIKSEGKYKADLDEVQKIWKEYKSVPESEGGLAGYQFNSQVFNNYKGMVDFANRIVKAFPKSISEGSDLTRAKAVFGIDNAATSLFSMVAGYNNGDKSKAISVLTGKKVDYKSYWNDKSSPRYQAFKAAYDVLDDGINNKSIYITSSGEYNSLYLKNHQEVFSIGSSAGYKYNFFSKQQENFSVKYNDSSNKERRTSSLQSKHTVLINKSTIFKQDSKSDNFIISTLSGTDKKISKETKEELDKIIQTIGDKSYLLFTVASVPKDIDSKVTQKLKTSNEFKKYPPFLLKNYVSHELQKTSNKLNEDEVETLPGPEKFDSNSQKSSIVSQGPDLIAIHANKKEDEAVRVFFNWLLNTKVAFPKGEDETESLTPIEYWVQQTSYIAPYKLNFENQDFAKDKNAGKRITWTQFNKFLSEDNKDNKYQLIYDTADAQSATFRDYIGTTITAVLSKAQENKKVSFDEFLDDLSKNLGPGFK